MVGLGMNEQPHPFNLCPFGVEGDEPMAMVEGFLMGICEGVWRGVVSREEAEKIYTPPGGWDAKLGIGND